MRKTRLLTLLALLMTAATGAWADSNTVTWDYTNAFVEANQSVQVSKFNETPFTCEGVTISYTGSTDDTASGFSPYDMMEQRAKLMAFYSNGGEFTFTAPTGKKFTKIEIINAADSYGAFGNHGDWTWNEDGKKAVWSGTASSTVKLSGNSDNDTNFGNISSIVFTFGTGGGDTKYTVTFAANNNTVNVENITLPHTFSASYNTANEEFDLILKELYGWSGNPNYLYPATAYDLEISDDTKVVSTKPDSYTQCLTINNVFEGSVTVKGTYVVNGPEFEYTVAISISAPAKYTVKMADDAGEGWTIDPTEAAEGTPVTATYEGSRHVKSVTAVVKALTITVGGQTVYYVAGDSWATALARPENAELGWNVTDNDIRNSGILYANSDQENAVTPSSLIDPTKTYSFFK